MKSHRQVLAAAALTCLAASAAQALNVTINPTNQTGINNAINQVAAAGGGTVFMNAGNYTITGTVAMKGKVAMDGAGASTVVRGTSSSNTFHNIDCGTDNSDNMTVRDLKVDTWDGSGIGVHFTASTISDDNNAIINVEQFHSASHGINGGGQNNLRVQNTYVHDSGGGSLYHNQYWRRWSYPSFTGNRSLNSRVCGFKMSWGNNLTFSGNTCTGNGADGIIAQHTSSQPNLDITVSSCTLSSNNTGTMLYGDGMKVTGSTARSNRVQGFYINNNPCTRAGYIQNSTACYNAYNFDPHGCNTSMSGNTTCQ